MAVVLCQCAVFLSTLALGGGGAIELGVQNSERLELGRTVVLGICKVVKGKYKSLKFFGPDAVNLQKY